MQRSISPSLFLPAHPLIPESSISKDSARLPRRSVAREYSDAELLLGRHNIENREPLFSSLVDAKISPLKKRIDGLKLSGQSADCDEMLLKELEKIKEREQ